MAKKNKKSTKDNQPKFRTPVVAVLGHVDHGKTSILDAIRGTRVQAKEHGGITQNTRAHQITTDNGNKITFIDTPGHEAFSAMRSRGAEATDFVLLVVAADDGVQPQTKESIKFAKEAGAPIIVAINKVDIDGVKPDKVKQQLSSFDVMIEEYGGEAMCFEVSATKGTGLTELVEGIELLAEVHELKPKEMEHDALGEAYVLESTTDKQLGSVALCILKAGELSGKVYGAAPSQVFKVRALLDQHQKPTQQVQESDPFWVTGLKDPLHTGDTVLFATTDKQAEELQKQMLEAAKTEAEESKKQDAKGLLMQMLLQKKAEEMGMEQKTLNVVLRASTQGTLEVVKHKLEELGDDEKKVNIIHAEPGIITEDDIHRAKAAGGIILSFQVPIPGQIEKIARQNKILVRNYEIIYEMLEELEAALEGLIEPEETEVEVARASVRQVFTLSDGTIVAGCEVVNGTIVKGYQVYVERPSLSTKDEIAELGRGKISSLKVRKEEAREVKKGNECGILINPTVKEIQEDDEIVAYKLERA